MEKEDKFFISRETKTVRTKETFSVEVCQRWNRGDKVQLEDESGFRLCCELVILCTGKAAPLGKEGNIASDKVR